MLGCLPIPFPVRGACSFYIWISPSAEFNWEGAVQVFYFQGEEEMGFESVDSITLGSVHTRVCVCLPPSHLVEESRH